MFELSVNLEYMFREAGERLEDRIAAAAKAGFRKVEMFMTAGRDLPSLAKALSDHGVEMWTVVADPRTRIIDPETHAGFRDLFRKAAEDAVALGCRRVVVGSGPGAPYLKRDVQLATVAAAVQSVIAIAGELDVTILLEPVNTRVDHPGVLFSMTEDAVSVIRQVNSPRVRLLYDLYHSITEGEDPRTILPAVIGLVEHIQIADAPGRGEPGSGNVNWDDQLNLVKSTGYQGVIGVECSPTLPSTATALSYIKSLCESL